jgi:beta-glucanase (GH16 family)
MMKVTKKISFFIIILLSVLMVSCTEEPIETEPIQETEDTTIPIPIPSEDDTVDLSMYDETTGRLITFFDDFNGDELDESVWEHMIGTGSQYGLGYWGNNEKQFYKSENSIVENGELKIQLRKEQTVADNGTGTIMEYTSSRIRTKGSFYQTYGRFEARIKFDVADDGLWPAFWMLPENNTYGGWPYSGEIDIMEIRGRRPNHTTSAVHFYNNGHRYIANEVMYEHESSITDYHVYAVEWTPNDMTFYVDDQIVLHTNSWSSNVGEYPAPFNQDFHLLINFAVGGNFDGNRLPSDDSLPATMYIDYVKVLAHEDEDGRKKPEGNGLVYLTYDELNFSLSDESTELEFFVIDGKKTDVAWFSSDTNIAVVNQRGKVTFLKEGTVTIRVATEANEANCVITITND